MKTKFILVVIAFALMSTDYCVAQSNQRGVKREKEECEEYALQVATNPRASASATSNSESLALRLAMTLAREELAKQMASEVNSVAKKYVEQYQMTAGAGTTFNKNDGGIKGSVTGKDNAPTTLSAIFEADSILTIEKVSQIVSNTKPVCKNTYDQTDGSVIVYVCVEMGLAAQREAYKELKEAGVIEKDLNNDGENDIDLEEKEFLIELAKAREEYNAKKIDN